jgi:hypothetical protein
MRWKADAMSPPRNPPPDPAPQRRVIRPWERPETEFGVLVPGGILQFDRPEPTGVAITALWAYSNGFEFMVTRILPPDGPGFDRLRGHTSDGGRMGPAVHENLMTGLEFADGSQVLGHVPSPAGADEEPPSRVVDMLGGGGGHRGDVRWWTWPLPPPGRLDFICQLGAAETRVSMDAQLILDASQRSAQAWPDA